MFANRGMIIEELINRTILYYKRMKIGLIEKRHLPIKIRNIYNGGVVLGKLLGKSLTDYCGVINGVYVDFEAKETKENYFDLSNIKQHQIEHMKEVSFNKGITFLIVCFTKTMEVFLWTIDGILNYVASNSKKRISYDYFLNNILKMDIISPGVLDFKKALGQ